MRILFVCNEYPPGVHGGVGSFVNGLSRALAQRGHAVRVVGFDSTVQRDTTQDEGGLLVTRLHSPYAGSWLSRIGRYDLAAQVLQRMALSQRVKQICAAEQMELVESYDWSGPLWAHPGVPLLVRMHGAHSAHALYEGRRSPRFLSFIERRNLRLADQLVGVSRHISDLTLRAAGLVGVPYRLIYNGVDTALFKPLGLERAENEVLFAGTVARRKGIYELFAAIPMVLRRIPQARFTVVGRLPQDENTSKASVEELLQNIPPDQRGQVRFTGAQPHGEMPAWYNRATCAVFPSLAEAFGLTCAEAMACGTPVVMTSRASGPELVEDGVSGLLADPQNPRELADALITYLENREFRKSVSQNSIHRIQEKFDLDQITVENIDFYEKALNNGK